MTSDGLTECPLVPRAAALREGWQIRALGESDLVAVFRLNADNYPAVQLLDEATMHWLLAFDGRHLVAVDPEGTVAGYLLAIPSASAYDDTEIHELRRRVTDPFHYICQVVIAPGRRGTGLGRALYAAVAETARGEGAMWLCCDVNLDPPNPASLAFHRRLGFADIESGTASNGFTIAYLARRL